MHKCIEVTDLERMHFCFNSSKKNQALLVILTSPVVVKCWPLSPNAHLLGAGMADVAEFRCRDLFAAR
jgi:hypothetical protein